MLLRGAINAFTHIYFVCILLYKVPRWAIAGCLYSELSSLLKIMCEDAMQLKRQTKLCLL